MITVFTHLIYAIYYMYSGGDDGNYLFPLSILTILLDVYLWHRKKKKKECKLDKK